MAKNCQQILPWHHLAEVFVYKGEVFDTVQ